MKPRVRVCYWCVRVFDAHAHVTWIIVQPCVCVRVRVCVSARVCVKKITGRGIVPAAGKKERT